MSEYTLWLKQKDEEELQSLTNETPQLKEENKRRTLTVKASYDITYEEDEEEELKLSPLWNTPYPCEQVLILQKNGKQMDAVQLEIPDPKDDDDSDDDEEEENTSEDEGNDSSSDDDAKDEKKEKKAEEDEGYIRHCSTKNSFLISDKGRAVKITYFGRHRGFPTITEVEWKGLPGESLKSSKSLKRKRTKKDTKKDKSKQKKQQLNKEPATKTKSETEVTIKE